MKAMEKLEQFAILGRLIELMREHGSWCGETHVQKCTYFLQSIRSVPTGFEFILYKHGPYSFDLSDVLGSMRANSIVSIQPRYPYGVSIHTDVLYGQLVRMYAATLHRYDADIRFVAEELGSKTVAELERLATALYVTNLENKDGQDVESRATELNRLKPHIPLSDARVAVKAVDELIRTSALTA
jgi:uncharacterized protein YwgA